MQGRVYEAPAPDVPPLPLEEASAKVLDAIRLASQQDHLTMVEAPCGLGKTEAAITVARERASKGYASAHAVGMRAPLGSKTVFSFPTNRLAEEAAARIASDGTRVKRLASLLTVLAPDGRPACAHYDFARALSDGGQSIREALCDSKRAPCQHREGCIARDSEGVSGHDDARITVTNHGLLRQASDEAGTSGMLVVDEIPAMSDTVLLDVQAIQAAIGEPGERFFEPKWIEAITPAVEAFTAWVMGAALTAIEGDYHTIAPGQFGDVPEKQAPPVLARYSIPARRGRVGQAAEFARLSRELREFRRLALSGGTVHLEADPRRAGVLLVRATMRSPAAYVLAHRQGPTVLLDAAAALRRTELGALFAVPPPIVSVSVADGAPVARTLIRTLATGRRGREHKGRFQCSTQLAHAVRVAVAWALEAPLDELLVVAPRLVRLALEHAHPATGPARRAEITADWHRMEQPADALAQAADLLTPALAPLDAARLHWGHYGAVRGLDTARSCSAMVTLGDPWPNLGSMRQEQRHLAPTLTPEQLARAVDARMVSTAAAELEQAHGRLRTPRRSVPARALHVGTVAPRGWQGHAVRQMPPGRPVAPARPEAMAELADLVASLGGQRAAARTAGVDRAWLRRQLSGEAAPTAETIQRLRHAADSLR